MRKFAARDVYSSGLVPFTRGCQGACLITTWQHHNACPTAQRSKQGADARLCGDSSKDCSQYTSID